VAVGVDEVQHAVTDALDDRRVDRAACRLVGDLLGTVGEGRGQHVGGRLREADREAARAGAVLRGEIGRERIGFLVDQEIAFALPVYRDPLRRVPRDRAETGFHEQVVQQARVRRGELDELEAVDSHRVLKRGDLHAEIGLRVHSGFPAGFVVHGGGGRVCWPHDLGHVIVSLETNCKPGHRTTDHTRLELERFLPYRLSILSNRMSQAIAREYQQRFDLSMTEWRVIAVLARLDGEPVSAREVAAYTAMDKVAISRA